MVIASKGQLPGANIIQTWTSPETKFCSSFWGEGAQELRLPSSPSPLCGTKFSFSLQNFAQKASRRTMFSQDKDSLDGCRRKFR